MFVGLVRLVGLVGRVGRRGLRGLEAELDAGFEAGEVQLEGCGAGGVGSVAGGQAGETVAAVEADGIVGDAGGDAEVELVVVLIFGIVDGAVGTFGMTVEFTLTDIMISVVCMQTPFELE